MGMHPKVSSNQFFDLFEMLFDKDKQQAYQHISNMLRLDADQIALLHSFDILQPNSPPWKDLVDYFWNKLEPLIDSSNHISTRSALEITKNIISSSIMYKDDWVSYSSRTGKVALDFGAGVYRPLCTASIFYCNGFDRVYAFEPFPIKPDFAWNSFCNFISEALKNPEKFLMTGTSKEHFSVRLKNLLELDSKTAINKFAAGDQNIINIGGVQLINSLDFIQNKSVDLHFSNAVLEHISDLRKSLSKLRELVTSNSIGYHIVDFADHRHYDDPSISPIEKYYDGVLDEINGYPPSLIEQEISSAGWEMKKITSQFIPDYFIERENREMIPIYKKYSTEELKQHINIYRINPSNSY